MLAEPKLQILQNLVSSVSKEELIWINGYLNGLVANEKVESESVSTSAIKNVPKKFTIVYGTETGNSKKLATDFTLKAKKLGIPARVQSLEQYRLTDLSKEEYLLAVISTQGEGEPPIAAKKFYDHIHQNGFKLEHVKYSVLALGDTSYPLFCKTGEDVDVQLDKLGAKRIAPIQKCDLEYDMEANAWFENILQNLQDENAASVEINTSAIAVVPTKSVGKKHYISKVLTHLNLNDAGSQKETWHIELEAEEVEYEPGDSIGIVPTNNVATVETIIAMTGVDRNKLLKHKEEDFSVEELLQNKLSIGFLTERIVRKYGEITGHDVPLQKADLLDLLKAYPIKSIGQFEEILVQLNPIAPRLYTIASSPLAHNGEVHITVEKVAFEVNDEARIGVASHFLGQTTVEDEVGFFVQKNKRFRLPADDKDIIMIGAGTGIAAYRSFLYERDSKGATGKNWLLFGEENFTSDFLYQTEIQNWFELELLDNVSLAFAENHTQSLKIHQKIIEQGEGLYKWMEAGAYVYVCGEKDPMGVEVEHALLQIIQQHGNKNAEEAKTYFEGLKTSARYSKDVY